MAAEPVTKELLEAHLGGLNRELRDIKDQQKTGFNDLKTQIASRDAHTDRAIEDINLRVDSLERTLNRWGGAFALALLVITLGMPLVLWGISEAVR